MRDRMMIVIITVLTLLIVNTVQANINCDGVDDKIDTATAFSNFASASTTTLMIMYRPTGFADGPGSSTCYDGERLYVIYTGGSGDLGIYRNGNLSGNNRMCASNYSSSEQKIEATYSNDVWIQLWLVHGGGTLYFYKDGALVSSVSSGNTSNVSTVLQLCQGGEDAQMPGEGMIAEASVYSTDITASHIAAIGKANMHTYGMVPVRPTGMWLLDECTHGGSGNAVTFRNRGTVVGNMTGNDGGNNTGLVCSGSSMSYTMGVYE